MRLAFDITHICEYSEHEDRDYGSWSEDYRFHMGPYVKISNDKNDYPIDFEVKKGDTIYAIVALWSHGNSFGTASNASYDIVGVYRSLPLAEKNLEILKEKTEKEDYEYSCKLLTESGTEIGYYIDWKGYFNSLSFLEIRPLIVK